jgi:hypothetical protein
MERAVRALSSALRVDLAGAVLAGRRAAEAASRAALDRLGVFDERRPEHLDNEQASLRVGLRAKWRQLGGDRELLVAECAYEQWHRLLFARFLAENSLLLHPEFRAPVTLAECEELAGELGEPDGWSVAGRFAAEILPGIFRLDDPCVQLRFAPEGRDALERIVAGLPNGVFAADDALGWVYQFWQKDKKDEVNDSERKIGGADLGPVTQLFTENYMVRFLLENSLGAWWASRHPDSPLIKSFDYLRFDDNGEPAAGSFDGWPARVAEVTVMDPCCGSGHFLVEAFSMLWKMRAEEEAVDGVDAQDAVLRDNLFGLELDPRCVQIAMFAVALQAWKAGGGWRQLPVPSIACSGIPVNAPADEWLNLAGEDTRLEAALHRLHRLFSNADTLGSLIDPRRVAGTSAATAEQRAFEDVDWEEVVPFLEAAVRAERPDPATAVLGLSAVGIAQAAELLSAQYCLVATNVPYLATAFIDRCLSLAASNDGCVAAVSPEGWQFLATYETLRVRLLTRCRWRMSAQLGPGAFEAVTGEVVKPVLTVIGSDGAREDTSVALLNTMEAARAAEKARAVRRATVEVVRQRDLLANPRAVISAHALGDRALLEAQATCYQGLSTGENTRYVRMFWEIGSPAGEWDRLMSAPSGTEHFAGRQHYVRWRGPDGVTTRKVGALRGKHAWRRRGVLVGRMGSLSATIYHGELFDDGTGVFIPQDETILPAIWSYAASDQFAADVRKLDTSIKVTNATLAKVPFDVERWRRVAAEEYPDGLPQPSSDDPTQWLFEGRPEASRAPLQVAVGRLVGYRWPDQPEFDDLAPLADADGIVCLPSVAGEPPAAERLERVLATGFGGAWTPSKPTELLALAGSKKKNLDDWVRDEFFKQHCGLFANRPFVWHVWDGRRDGFSALVNYHRLDRRMLEKLTYTYLGQDWVERQRAELRDEVPGAEDRLAAALELRRKLEAILEGEAPFDIYVRWKGLHQQPIGWEPDLNDGVRLNVRPFVKASVLRASFNLHWKKDRGKNPDGSDRDNDPHLTLTEKRAARMQSASA